MKIAVTSQNFSTVTGHAGHARRFVVFDIAHEGTPVEVARLDLDERMVIHGFDPSMSHPLDEADVLITAGAGAGFVQRMAARGVRVVATAESDPGRAVEAFLAGQFFSPTGGCGAGGSHTSGHHGGGGCGCHG